MNITTKVFGIKLTDNVFFANEGQMKIGAIYLFLKFLFLLVLTIFKNFF